jgi:hypothetical protein
MSHRDLRTVMPVPRRALLLKRPSAGSEAGAEIDEDTEWDFSRSVSGFGLYSYSPCRHVDACEWTT